MTSTSEPLDLTDKEIDTAMTPAPTSSAPDDSWGTPAVTHTQTPRGAPMAYSGAGGSGAGAGAGAGSEAEAERDLSSHTPSSPLPTGPRYINLNEAAELAEVSPMTIRHHTMRKNINGSQNRSTGKWSIDRYSVLEWMKHPRPKRGPTKRKKSKSHPRSGAVSTPSGAAVAAPVGVTAEASSGVVVAGGGGVGKHGLWSKGMRAADLILEAFPDEDGAQMAREIFAKLQG